MGRKINKRSELLAHELSGESRDKREENEAEVISGLEPGANLNSGISLLLGRKVRVCVCVCNLF